MSSLTLTRQAFQNPQEKIVCIGLPGIIEYSSQTNDCADFVKSDEKYRYIDDLSILEIINLISVGMSSYNCKIPIPNDVMIGNTYMPPENLKSQNCTNLRNGPVIRK